MIYKFRNFNLYKKTIYKKYFLISKTKILKNS